MMEVALMLEDKPALLDSAHGEFVIHAISGEFIGMVDFDGDVQSLKAELASLSGIPSWAQMLIVDGKLLQDGDDLHAAPNVCRSTIALMRNTEAVLTVEMMSEWHQKHTIDSGLLQDRDFMLAAVRESGAALQYAPVHLRSDAELVLTAVQTSGAAFQYAARELQRDYHFALTAVRTNGSAIQHVAKPLLQDRNF